MLERYRYSIALVGIVLLLLPRLGSPVNGAYLSFHIGPIAFQPAELAKIAIVIFLASYLRDTRQVLVVGARRFMGITFPPLKHLGPLLAVWGTAMVLLFVIQDLGSSLMFFGAFLALVYVATNRISFVVIGLGPVRRRRARAVRAAPDDPEPRRRLAAPVRRPPLPPGRRRQLPDRAVDLLAGRRRAVRPRLRPGADPARRQRADPARGAHGLHLRASSSTSSGLLGGVAVLLVYLLIIERGFKTAMIATDSFSKLLATGLTAVLALQVFVIVGGVTKLIPLTGVTLPFISYGGSSIVANFILLALLLLVSDRARREAQALMNAPILKLFGLILVLFAALDRDDELQQRHPREGLPRQRAATRARRSRSSASTAA